MAKGVFTSKIEPIYDDLREERYHFPNQYLNRVREMLNDFIIYYEPRRNDGRQAYIATARVASIEPDRNKGGHYYAYMTDYIDFTNPVSFRIGDEYLEYDLVKSDGTTNRGRFRHSVRLIPEHEYNLIIQYGFQDSIRELLLAEQ